MHDLTRIEDAFMPTPISLADYHQITTHTTLPVVVEFYAAWCPKCMMMKSVYERVASRLTKYMTFYKIDVATSSTLVSELGIEIYPTFIVYQKGKILGFTSGVLPEKVLFDRLLNLVSPNKKR